MIGFNKIIRNIILFISFLLFLLSLFELSEFVNVGLLENTSDYPWGCEEGGWNYKTPETYSKAALISGLFCMINSILLFWGIIKSKWILVYIGIGLIVLEIIVSRL